MNIITLKPGKEKSLLRRHPWIYATGIASTEGRCEPGATVIVRAADGRFLAQGRVQPRIADPRARVDI